METQHHKIEIMEVPMDFYNQFKGAYDDSMRDIAGMPTISIHPLFSDPTGLNSCIDYSIINPFDDTNMQLSDSLQIIYETNFYMHLDGSSGGDGFGLCLAHLHSFTNDPEPLPIIKIDFLGSPNRKSYGDNFKPEMVEELIRDLIDRGIKIKIISYDRATNVRLIRDIVEPSGTIVASMSIDYCTSYPIIDYDKQEPPYIKMESTKGYYDLPMTDFRNIANRGGIITPYHKQWTELMFCFEHNEKTHKVTKVSGKEDNLGQAVAGTIFHVLNNEKEIIKVSASKLHEWSQQIQPDNFTKLLDSIQKEEGKRINQIGGVDKDFSTFPDEMAIPDDPSSKWDNPFLI